MQQLGDSAGGRPIYTVKLTDGPINLLLIGGVHGDEPEGYYLVEEFINSRMWMPLQDKAALWVIPRMNPDGCEQNARCNDNGVDLNRNMPTRDWSPVAAKPKYNPGPHAASEPETKILINLIETLKPRAIISAHSWEPQINYNGPSHGLAQCMAHYSKYIVTDNIGYPTPGSLGTWAGWERNIPTITLEIERGSNEETIWQTHARALTEGLNYAAQNESLEQWKI